MKNGLIGFIVGVLISGFIVSASVLLSSDKISYNNTTVKDSLDNLFNESVDGKNRIAEAITNKGVATSETDSYDKIISNINNISTGNSYLTLNEETGYVQAMDSNGDWVNLAYIHSLPIQNISYIEDDLFVTSSFGNTQYSTKGTNCSISVSDTKLTGNVYHNESTNYTLDGYVPLNDSFTARGQTLALTTTRTTTGTFESGPTTSVYLQDENDVKTLLGTISTGTYTYVVPNDNNNYKIVFRIYGKGYGTGTGYSKINLTISELNLTF